MLVTERRRLHDDIGGWVALHGGGRPALIPVLQEIQRRYGHISEYAMQELAHLLDIHPVEVYSVVSFYSFLDEKPRGSFVIRLCRTVSCEMEGKDRVARQLENDLGVPFGETTSDGKFTLDWANCLGMCDQGPALLINDRVFTAVTPETVHGLIQACRRSFGPLALQEKAGRGHA